MKRLGILVLIMLFAVAGCSQAKPEPDITDKVVDPLTLDVIKAIIEVEGYGAIELELYPALAPQTVCNFAFLVRQGYYDGQKFNRIVPESLLLCGGADTLGYTIRGEFAANGCDNPIAHERGVISMARLKNDYDSAGAEFFIVLQDSADWDGKHAAFGRVVDGLDVLDALAKVEVDLATYMPLSDVVIASITIDGPLLPIPEMLGANR